MKDSRWLKILLSLTLMALIAGAVSTFIEDIEYGNFSLLAAQMLLAVLTVWILSTSNSLQERALESSLEVSRKSEEWQERTHQREMIQEFARRYESLYTLQASGRIMEPTPFFRAFWSLQFEQFRMWREGLVPDSTYRFWLEARRAEFDSEYKIYTASQLEELERVWKVWYDARGTASETDHQEEFRNARKALGHTFTEGWERLDRNVHTAPGWGSTSFYQFIEKLRKLEAQAGPDMVEEIRRLMEDYKASRSR